MATEDVQPLSCHLAFYRAVSVFSESIIFLLWKT